jgi:glycosyltransferase involved in cell wall biosynthesis
MESARDHSWTGRHRIVVIAPRIVASFVKQDVDLLSADFESSLVSISGAKSISRCYFALRHASAILVWFLGRHAIPAILIARALKVPVVSVIGGFEVAWESDIRYGIRPRSIQDSALRWMLRKSDSIITVSEFSCELAKSRLPEVAGRMTLIHNAIDTSRFAIDLESARSGVLCVATLSADSIRVKNLEKFRMIAEAMPDTEFSLVGPALDSEARKFTERLPGNVKWMGQLLGDDLVRAYQSASVYLQISRHESFSVALAEAMACGCVPVVSAHGALPEVGGSVARVLPDLELETCIRALRDASIAPAADRIRAREHVTLRFSTEQRRIKLEELFTGIIRSKQSYS